MCPSNEYHRYEETGFGNCPHDFFCLFSPMEYFFRNLMKIEGPPWARILVQATIYRNLYENTATSGDVTSHEFIQSISYTMEVISRLHVVYCSAQPEGSNCLLVKFAPLFDIARNHKHQVENNLGKMIFWRV